MKQLMCVVVLTLVAPNLIAGECDTKGVIVEKSFLQSVHDCTEYLQIPKERLVQYMANEFPPDDETKCLLFCVGVDLGWWNNTCGLQAPSMISYFQPVQGDKQYEKRTKECLERRVGAIESPNSCCQAYETFQCYFQEFGNLVTCPQYVRLTKLQATQAAYDCLVMMRYPEDLLKVYANGKVEDSPETRCLYHCIDHRTGLYTQNGISLSRFFIRDSSYNDYRYLSKETRACRDRIRHSGCDKCTEVYKTHQECLAGLGENGYTSGIITAGAQIALTDLGVSCAAEPVKSCTTYQPYHHPTYPPTKPTYTTQVYTTTKKPCSVCNNRYEAAKPYPSPVASVEPAVALSYSSRKPSTTCSKGSMGQVYNLPFVAYRGPSCSCKRCAARQH
uniref:Odorant-binding protein n=1 Tax=Anopheles funestus TaxID=62324 RepID=A0A182RLX5_ANOFN